MASFQLQKEELENRQKNNDPFAAKPCEQESSLV